MTLLTISPGNLPKEVFIPSSKSYANRILILAALSKRPFTIEGLPASTDVTFLVECLKQIGIKFEGNSVVNSFPECETEDKEIDVGEGGTTARFLASMLLKGSKKYRLILGHRLKDRPWSEFLDFVRRYSGRAELEDNVLTVQGPLQLPAEVRIDCARTTQFASGIRLTGVKVIPVNLDSSSSYWQMTEELIRIVETQDFFKVPLDWSSASYPLVFGALRGPVVIPGLEPDPYQSDSKLHYILIEIPRVIDVSDCLDLVPALSFLLAHTEGKHELVGIKNLVHKESDRLSEVIRLLNLFDRKSYEENGKLFIEGHTGKIERPVDLVMPDDHRMVMTGALFLRYHSGGTISPAEAVSKSYPDFFKLFA